MHIKTIELRIYFVGHFGPESNFLMISLRLIYEPTIKARKPALNIRLFLITLSQNCMPDSLLQYKAVSIKAGTMMDKVEMVRQEMRETNRSIHGTVAASATKNNF